ncbi:MAG TPA: DUF4405 domain-containing protein [Edaphocola sp.]|nr:DUF4405 domain-containing protein [Edaphocola sp.]
MKRSTLNFILNAIMFIFMAALTGTGFLMKYALISGQESWVVYGTKVDLFFAGMDRHEWGYIHLILGYILLGLVILHVILHWKIVVAVYNRLFEGSLMVKLVTLLIVAICALFIIAPFFIQPKVVESERGGGNHSGKRNMSSSLAPTKATGSHFNFFFL